MDKEQPCLTQSTGIFRYEQRQASLEEWGLETVDSDLEMMRDFFKEILRSEGYPDDLDKLTCWMTLEAYQALQKKENKSQREKEWLAVASVREAPLSRENMTPSAYDAWQGLMQTKAIADFKEHNDIDGVMYNAFRAGATYTRLQVRPLEPKMRAKKRSDNGAIQAKRQASVNKSIRQQATLDIVSGIRGSHPAMSNKDDIYKMYLEEWERREDLKMIMPFELSTFKRTVVFTPRS